MKKTSEELIANAKKLIAKAKKMEEAMAVKIGKMIIELFHANKITDEAIITKIKSTIIEPPKVDKRNHGYTADKTF